MRYSRTILCVQDGGKEIGDIVDIGGARYRIAKEIAREEFDRLVAKGTLKLHQAFQFDAKTRSRAERPVRSEDGEAIAGCRFYRLVRIAVDE